MLTLPTYEDTDANTLSYKGTGARDLILADGQAVTTF